MDFSDFLFYLLVSAILTGILLYIVFPKMIYFLANTTDVLMKIVDYCKEKADDFSVLLIIRLIFLVAYMIVWVVLFIVFVPMMIFGYLEIFGGFIGDEDSEV